MKCFNKFENTFLRNFLPNIQNSVIIKIVKYQMIQYHSEIKRSLQSSESFFWDFFQEIRDKEWVGGPSLAVISYRSRVIHY